MGRKTISYRGNLKSCNYRCSYCPFSKHKALAAELERDKQNFRRFCDSIERRVQEFSIGAVFVAPYGEASVHRWYWEGLGRLSGIPGIDRVGLQTNLSFSVEECLGIFDLYGSRGSSYGGGACDDDAAYCDAAGSGGVCGDAAGSGGACGDAAGSGGACGDAAGSGGACGDVASRGGACGDASGAGDGYDDRVLGGGIQGDLRRRREKLCIWATFHPEMTDADAFAAKCHELSRSGVRLCAGAVGVPRNIPVLGRLRKKLSPDLYLWINRMDGLGRNYTAEEREAFSEIDPFFETELNNPAADAAMCADRCFVEADGSIRACNIGRTKDANWYEGAEEEIFRPFCGKRRCSCYLAYAGRADFERRHFFGGYPIFRIPERRKAVFLDLDGTLVPEGTRGGLPDMVRRRLRTLRKKYPVFLATSMPEEEAGKRLKGDMDLFEGAVFASGAHVRLRGRMCGGDGEGTEFVHPVDVQPLPLIREFAQSVNARIRVYEKNGMAYKITIFKSRNCIWTEGQRQSAAELLEQWGCRIFTERNCLEIIGKGFDKGSGIREICGWLGILPEETIAVGNDGEDKAMEKVCGAYFSVKV